MSKLTVSLLENKILSDETSILNLKNSLLILPLTPALLHSSFKRQPVFTEAMLYVSHPKRQTGVFGHSKRYKMIEVNTASNLKWFICQQNFLQSNFITNKPTRSTKAFSLLIFIINQNKMLIQTFVQGKSGVMWWVLRCWAEQWVEARSEWPFLRLSTGPENAGRPLRRWSRSRKWKEAQTAPGGEERFQLGPILKLPKGIN